MTVAGPVDLLRVRERLTFDREQIARASGAADFMHDAADDAERRALKLAEQRANLIARLRPSAELSGQAGELSELLAEFGLNADGRPAASA